MIEFIGYYGFTKRLYRASSIEVAVKFGEFYGGNYLVAGFPTYYVII